MIFGRGFPLQCFPFPHKKRPFACLNQQKSFSLPQQSNILQSMKDKTLHLISILLAGCSTFPALAQNFSSSSNLKPQPTADRVVPFRLSDKGITHKYVEWGADIAWLDENNLRRSAAFMGKDNLDVVRTSFQPDLPIVDGKCNRGQSTHCKCASTCSNGSNPMSNS